MFANDVQCGWKNHVIKFMQINYALEIGFNVILNRDTSE